MKCPICKQEAVELETGLFDGHALRCPTHGKVGYFDTVRAARAHEDRDAWERAYTKAATRAVKDGQHETVGGAMTVILDSDF
ncbi:hypothetical protein [Bradyrhizobium jicamae]|uniref:hypothetical protein n=1 Tax=Bradyrhizobium jicamae TaxID=280332 RepID=UPI001BA87F7C|nr:hypothetical protein [Bradyrhizobium jicamae]MBR0939037.1 hypothetical protein [Bradyrhizobium jicamae]